MDGVKIYPRIESTGDVTPDRCDATVFIFVVDERDGVKYSFGTKHSLSEQRYIDAGAPNVARSFLRVKSSDPEFPSEQQRQLGFAVLLLAESQHRHWTKEDARYDPY